MVFTKLSVQEKDAFFGLLDEYFRSRPELFSQNGNAQGSSGLAGTATSTAAAASVVQRALTAAGSTTGSASGASIKSNNPYAANMPNSPDLSHAMTVGRVAAASLAFSGGPQPPSQPHVQPGPDTSARASLERAVSSSSEIDKLTRKKASPPSPPTLGSGLPSNASAFSAFSKKPEAVGVTIPSAFAAPKNAYGPPPVRRVTSEATTGTSSVSGDSGGGAMRIHAQRTESVGSEVARGEWAEVLYDYSSEDPGDLAIEASMRVLVTDKSSDDWWTGQVEGRGRQGLFPASYVKLL